MEVNATSGDISALDTGPDYFEQLAYAEGFNEGFAAGVAKFDQIILFIFIMATVEIFLMRGRKIAVERYGEGSLHYLACKHGRHIAHGAFYCGVAVLMVSNFVPFLKVT